MMINKSPWDPLNEGTSRAAFDCHGAFNLLTMFYISRQPNKPNAEVALARKKKQQEDGNVNQTQPRRVFSGLVQIVQYWHN